MLKRSVTATVMIAALGLTGCVNTAVSERISSLQVCAESLRILTEMEQVLRVALANPLEASAQAERLSELSGEFKALVPQEANLQAAHADVSARMDVVLETVQNPSLASVAELPAVIAQSQTALVNYAKACSP
jgi:hypothetical protein